MERHHFLKILNLVLFIGVIIALLIFIQPSKEGFVIKDPDVKIVKGSQLGDFHNSMTDEKTTSVIGCDGINV